MPNERAGNNQRDIGGGKSDADQQDNQERPHQHGAWILRDRNRADGGCGDGIGAAVQQERHRQRTERKHDGGEKQTHAEKGDNKSGIFQGHQLMKKSAPGWHRMRFE